MRPFLGMALALLIALEPEARADADAPLRPRIAGPWRTIAANPDLGPLSDPKQQPVDFALWRATDGTWQLWSCIRGTHEPGYGRLLHRWESPQLQATNWTAQGIALQADPALGEARGGLQAPHVVRHGNRFHMVYGDWNHICLASSDDGRQFARHRGPDGRPQVFAQGTVADNVNTRDPMALRIHGLWHCYYTAHPDQQGAVYARTSTNLVDWSDARIVAARGQAGDSPYAAECPFVVEPRPGHFFLFRTQRYGHEAQSSVYYSRDPLDFGIDNDRDHFVGTLPVAAPEIVRAEGGWWIAALLPSLEGIRIAPLAWDTTSPMPDPPGQTAPGESARHHAYLFAHMMHGDYGRLYYSVSRDGLHWTLLNRGRRILEEYRGHPDLCRGHDGRYYLVGNRSDADPQIHFWVSDDLCRWTRHGDFTPNLKRVPGYPRALPRIGAPKLFFDAASSQYLLTWHTPHDMGPTTLPEPYWASQRTLYATSADLRTFSGPPRRLFDGELATIDTIVRRIGNRYYAIVKDERYPTLEWPTGKTVRVCSAPDLLGPYSVPEPPVSPNFREAPTLIPSPSGRAWYLYYEQYPGVAYGLSIAETLEGPWFQAAGGMHHLDWDKFTLPQGVRHGSMIPITEDQYELLTATFEGTL